MLNAVSRRDDVSRRTFVRVAAASGVALAAGVHTLPGAFAANLRRSQPLKILILGGTGFLGPACMETALARGHTVTLSNRGRTEDRRKRAGRPRVIPEGVEVLYGNRDTKIDPEFLTAQEVDVGMFPLWMAPTGQAAGFRQRNVAKAVKAGLTFRPVADTAKAALNWYNGLTDDLKSKMVGAMLEREREKELAGAFRKSGG